ncbi:Protein kinase C and casein kinase substrate in neuron protein 1 [Taenia crassiceps]|uniref:Protein kinase C and casein kinase substrate in neuron protein 1 n=1 Tax=Taenia crassiceps TaxID=6207 RepID=A0ABR4QM49_9CEST
MGCFATVQALTLTLEHPARNFTMSSMKDKVSRKMRFTFARTEQKLRPSRNYTKESNTDSLEQFRADVKEQKSVNRKLTEQWKKYLTRIQEAEKTAEEFEYTLLHYFNSSEERSLTVFPSFETCDLESGFEEVKEKSDAVSKTIKDTEALKIKYLANQTLYEKANDQKKEQEKLAMEESLKRLTDSMKGLQQCVPQILTKNDEALYQCVLKYFTSKHEYLNKMLSETKGILDKMKDARFSAPISSKYYRSSSYQSPTSGCQTPSNDGTAKDQPVNSTTIPPANGHEVKGIGLPTYSTHSSNEQGPNGAGASTRNQASSELSSRTPPFDVIAAFAYTSEEQDELGFEANDDITVLPWEDSEDESKNPEPGWLYGKHKKSGLTGLFPANYVKLA